MEMVHEADTNLRNVWRMEFPELTWNQFEEVRDWAQGKGLGIAEVYARPEGRIVKVVPRVDWMLANAHATGQFAGVDEPTFQRDADGAIVSATAVVYRLMGGQRCRFAGVAHWEDFAVPADPSWRDKPQHRLFNCALANALRLAFPDEGILPAEPWVDPDRADEPAAATK